MSDITKEIEQTAEKMEKSTQTPKEILFETIRQLGPDGIRSKLPTLEKSEQELLVGALQEMKKAVEMDKDYQAKFVQGKITDTKIQEDKADDDQDEKLVKPEAATIAHQGTPTDGWDGQVIKGKKVGFKAVEEKAKEEGAEDPKAVAAAVGIEKYGKEGMEAKARAGKMKKGDEMDEKVMKDAKKKAKSGDKEKMIEGLKEMKKALELSMPGATPELIKGEMKRLLAEEDQDGDAPEMDVKTRANKENIDALNLASDNKAAQKKVNDEKQGMKKAVWGGENDLIKALSGGRNHHFSLEEYMVEVLKEAGKPAEEIKKSETKKEDLNDIIAKGQDTTWDDLNCERMIKSNKEKVRGKIVKSFEDDEIAQALGLSPEEAKKILGE